MQFPKRLIFDIDLGLEMSKTGQLFVAFDSNETVEANNRKKTKTSIGLPILLHKFQNHTKISIEIEISYLKM